VPFRALELLDDGFTKGVGVVWKLPLSCTSRFSPTCFFLLLMECLIMKNFFLTLFSSVTLIATVTIAHADEIKIGAGSADGEYTNTIVPAISNALEKHGYTAVAEISAGSQENIDNVMSGKLPVGLSQLDVAALNMTPENDQNESLVVLGGKIAPEALFCAAHKGGNVKSYDDLTDEQETPLKISVGNKKGGTARTFQYLMKLDPELKNIKLYHKKKLKVELNRLLSDRRDLVCFVMMPNPDNKLIEMVMDHDELFFITIDRPAFAKATIGKTHIYDIMEVPVTSGFWGFGQTTIKTLVTWVGVVVNEDKVNEKLLDALASVAIKDDLLPSNSLAAKAKHWFEEIKAKVTD
jgi:TRAP-type uncharacterized transport system substrate-binding protein